jgi:hypothetical protein
VRAILLVIPLRLTFSSGKIRLFPGEIQQRARIESLVEHSCRKDRWQPA